MSDNDGAKQQAELSDFVIPPRGPVRMRKSGAGTHGDRRTKRLRERGASKRADIDERKS